MWLCVLAVHFFLAEWHATVYTFHSYFTTLLVNVRVVSSVGYYK